MRSILFIAATLIVLLITPSNSHAYDPLVKKQVFEIPTFNTQGGATIRNVKVGWEAYGSLNAAKDNVILICHYFSGSSHAAGKYAATDAQPGYWDAIIGSGKPIDTDKYYVISVDTLANLNTGDPNVTTTGPMSINPATEKPYGLAFPIVTIRDFVNVQRILLDSLGIETLHAVMGPSMGSLQAYEWAAFYPQMVERIVPVIGAGWADADLIAWLNIWTAPIKLDPNWNNGEYYDQQPPTKGLAEAFKIVTLHAQHWEWSNGTFGRAWANAGADPAKSFDNLFQVEAILDAAARSRAIQSDANHFLYLAKAVQLFYAGHGKTLQEGLLAIDAPVLIVHTDEDLIFPGPLVRDTARMIGSDGTSVRTVTINGTRGHLDGLVSIEQAGSAIKEFLEAEVP